jgi:hypothetical protein
MWNCYAALHNADFLMFITKCKHREMDGRTGRQTDRQTHGDRNRKGENLRMPYLGDMSVCDAVSEFELTDGLFTTLMQQTFPNYSQKTPIFKLY